MSFNCMMEGYQEINTLEDGVKFTKEGFDQLYEEYAKAEKINEISNKVNVVGGALIGIGVSMIISAVKRHYHDED